MPKVNITPENMKLVKEYAKICNMTEEECINHHLPRGIKRGATLRKHRDSSPKTAKKTAKKSAKKTASKANGKGKVTDAKLLKLKKGGMSNPQISKETGMSKDQVYRGLKRAQA